MASNEITGLFVLKPNVLLTPCAELADEVRARLTYEEGDYTVSHLRGRSLAQVVDRELATLLELFRQPRSIVDAVVESSRLLGKNPRRWLDELLPHFDELMDNRVLVPADSVAEHELAPLFDNESTIAGWTIVRCVSFAEDSEIYEVRTGADTAALKIARVDGMREIFDNETRVLRHLAGTGIAPRLVDAGTWEDRPYLLMEWIDGVSGTVAAAQRRHDRTRLIELCASIAAAYAALHAGGVIHADVHPENVLIGAQVRLVDFGYSRFVDEEPHLPRVGQGSFFEPEYWRDMPLSTAGEQYSVAALLYMLLAGDAYVPFRLDREELMRQVETEAPVPFAARGIAPWPEVEEILFRALEKDPSRRHASMASMAALLADARDHTVRDSLTAPLATAATAFLEETLASFSRGGAMFETRYTRPPFASINYGCAGAAVGLLRIAETRGDAALLALAEVWRSRAEALIGTEGAFWDDEYVGEEVIGAVTPYHTESGIHAAGAMIAAARGEQEIVDSSIAAFLDSSNRPCPALDLTLGRSATLLACAMLLPVSDEVRAFGSSTMTSIWTELDPHPPIAASPADTYLGMAHGWSGYLYAALRWCAASGDALPPRLIERLHQLAALRVADHWPTAIGHTDEEMIASWCHGTAGHLFLFTLAHSLLGDEQWLKLAEACARTTWEAPADATTLCCGTAGRAYALLHLYKHTGATEWLSRARQLANHAATTPDTVSTQVFPNALWKGRLGAAVLVADLASPEQGRMPFFE